MSTNLSKTTEARERARRLLFADWRLFFALGGGAGLTPKAPGTAGTALAVVVYWLAAALLPPAAVLALAGLFLAAGWHICDYANKALQQHDAGAVVWDETAAFFAALAVGGVFAAGWQWQAAAFVVFRFFDIVKPFPISWLDKNLQGGFGVMGRRHCRRLRHARPLPAAAFYSIMPSERGSQLEQRCWTSLQNDSYAGARPAGVLAPFFDLAPYCGMIPLERGTAATGAQPGRLRLAGRRKVFGFNARRSFVHFSHCHHFLRVQ